MFSLPYVVAFLDSLNDEPFPFEVAALIRKEYSAFCLSPLIVTLRAGAGTIFIFSFSLSTSVYCMVYSIITPFLSCSGTRSHSTKTLVLSSTVTLVMTGGTEGTAKNSKQLKIVNIMYKASRIVQLSQRTVTEGSFFDNFQCNNFAGQDVEEIAR